MRRNVIAQACFAVFICGQTLVQAGATSGEFAYQGQLKLSGVPVTDTCDFEFSLWRDPASTLAVDQIGPTLTFDGFGGNPASIVVTNGLFSALLNFGPTAFTDDARWLDIAVRCPAGIGIFTTLTPREEITAAPVSLHTRGIAVDVTGQVGIGTTSPDANLHVRGVGSFFGNHIAHFENTGAADADGIAIQINNRSTNRDNNFITFINGSRRVTGRIEGFDLENGDWISPPPLPRVSLGIDLNIDFNPNFLDFGSLPTVDFTRGQLPTASLTGGSFPSLSFTRGTLPRLNITGGALPSANFTRGTLPTANFSGGSLPSLSLNRTTILGIRVVTGITFSTGSLPNLSFSGGSLPSLTFSPGSFPNILLKAGTLPALSVTGGSFPRFSFTPGSLPNLTFSGGSLPSIVKSPFIFGQPSFTFVLPTAAELADLFCWANENDVSDFLTLDPVSLAAARLKEAAAKICKDEGVTYGSKGADYAEWLPKLDPSDSFQFGQIVGVHGGKVSLKTEGAEQIMAVSRAPVVVGNVPPEDEQGKYVTVGFMGQLPVVVRGKVKAGDYIIPSGLEDGTAVAVSPGRLDLEHLGRTLGRAWSESDNNVYNLINVVIGLNGQEAGIILHRQNERLERHARLQAGLAEENARLRSQIEAMNGKLSGVLAAVRNLEELGHAQSDRSQALVAAEVSR